MTIITGRLKLLAATASIIALAGMAAPAGAGGLSGVVGGVTGAVGGVVGGVTGSLGGVVGGATSSNSQATANSDAASTPNAGTPGTTPSDKALVRLKANILGIKAGVYVVDSNGNLVRINARLAHHLLNANVNAYVLHNGSLVKVYGNAGLAGLDAKAKVVVLDKNGNILDGKVLIGLGKLKAKLAAKAGANAGTGGANANINVSLGLDLGNGGGAGPGGGNPGAGNPPAGNPPGGNGNNSNNNGSGNRGISHEIATLSASERQQLTRKCPAVLSSPASYSSDAVRVCRVIGQLAGR